MKFKEKYPGIDDEDKFKKSDDRDRFYGRHVIVNDRLTIDANQAQIGFPEENYHIDMTVNDSNKKIKHRLIISVLYTNDYIMLVPTIYRVQIITMNGKDNELGKGILAFRQGGDIITRTNDVFEWEQERIDVDNNVGKYIFEELNKFINHFEPLKNDADIQNGLEIIKPSLEQMINRMQEVWKNLDYDYQTQVFELQAKIYGDVYADKARKLKGQIELLKKIQEDQKNRKK